MNATLEMEDFAGSAEAIARGELNVEYGIHAEKSLTGILKSDDISLSLTADDHGLTMEMAVLGAVNTEENRFFHLRLNADIDRTSAQRLRDFLSFLLVNWTTQ